MNFKIGFRHLGLLEMFSFVTVEILKPSHRSLHYDVNNNLSTKILFTCHSNYWWPVSSLSNPLLVINKIKHIYRLNG